MEAGLRTELANRTCRNYRGWEGHTDGVYTRQKPQVVTHKYPQHTITDTAVVAHILHTQRSASLLLQVQICNSMIDLRVQLTFNLHNTLCHVNLVSLEVCLTGFYSQSATWLHHRQRIPILQPINTKN